jgi:hypothetical protein
MWESGGKELYLLAVPDCLRCAQYTQDDSVVPPAVLQKSPKPAACRGYYVAVHGGSRQPIDPKNAPFPQLATIVGRHDFSSHWSCQKLALAS